MITEFFLPQVRVGFVTFNKIKLMKAKINNYS
jgi:hypothetical protein